MKARLAAREIAYRWKKYIESRGRKAKQRSRELEAEIKRIRKHPRSQGQRVKLTFKGNSIKYV